MRGCVARRPLLPSKHDNASTLKEERHAPFDHARAAAGGCGDRRHGDRRRLADAQVHVARVAARGRATRDREVREQPRPRESRRLPDHHADDPGHGLPLHEPQGQGFDVTKPAILVYERRGAKWTARRARVGIPKKPAKPPIQGAKYGSFGAACHYVDGSFVFADSQDKCAATGESGSKFNFWHPDLVTLHIWLWYPNPSGLYEGMNPLVAPFNES